MLKKPKLSILIEPGILEDFKLSVFENDKLTDSHVYNNKDQFFMDRLQFLMADVLSLLAPEMSDKDEQVLYVVKAAGLDYKTGKKPRKYTFSGSTKH